LIRGGYVLALIVLLLMNYPIYAPLDQPTDKNTGFSKPTRISSPSQELVIKTWHHDCSNTSGFQYGELPLPFPIAMQSYTVVNTEGVLESDGQCLYITNITELQGGYSWVHYGPTFIYDLPDVFPVAGLRNFSVQIELINSNPEARGAAAIGLFDENLGPILIASCRDIYPDTEGDLTWKYHPRNSSFFYLDLGRDDDDFSIFSFDWDMSFVNTTLSAAYSHDQGLLGSIPAYHTLNSTIVTENDVECNRAIKYLALTVVGLYSFEYFPIPPFRLQDIYLEYEIGGIIDTSPPLLTPQPDRMYIQGETGNTISWECYDDHPYRYWLLDSLDYSYSGMSLSEEGPWNRSRFNVSIDGLRAGNYFFELCLQDRGGFVVTDWVEVMVVEDTFLSDFVSTYLPPVLILSMVALVCVLDRRSRRKDASLQENQP
jgi:hypothetical protein